MNIKKSAKTGILVLSVAALAYVGGTMAYLTDYDTAANEFTVGKIDIELQEPTWKPEEHKKLVPTETIKKDPQVKNTGVNDAYVYLEVSVPMRNVVTADASGNRVNAKNMELFTFSSAQEWSLIDSYVKGENKIYLYAYTQIVKPNQTTKPLFQQMTFANIVEGQLDGKTLNVPVRAYAIQTANTGENKTSITEQAKEAFKKYSNQNQGQKGTVTQK
ncbi:MAG: Camelysin metallo-endopeptidase [Blautia sp.]|nr:Camelysin metallo-endopeptidase [Blautia sp.]